MFNFGPLWGNEEEAAIIGRLVLGYTELELLLWQLLSDVLKDSEQATALMFTPQSSKLKLDIADIIVRKAMRAVDLEEQYGNLFGELSKCRNIRNAYAHAYWDRTDDQLRYVKLEDVARTRNGFIEKKHMIPSPMKTLREQEQIFVRVYLGFEALRREFLEARAKDDTSFTA